MYYPNQKETMYIVLIGKQSNEPIQQLNVKISERLYSKCSLKNLIALTELLFMIEHKMSTTHNSDIQGFCVVDRLADLHEYESLPKFIFAELEAKHPQLLQETNNV